MQRYEHVFDTLIQELLQEKQQFERLVAENTQLRRQLAELREGKGVRVEILGQQFLLGETSSSSATRATPSPLSSGSNFLAQSASETKVLPALAGPSRGEPEVREPQTPASLPAVLPEHVSLATTQALAAVSPEQPTASPKSQEEQASLRRELVGSLLLE